MNVIQLFYELIFYVMYVVVVLVVFMIVEWQLFFFFSVCDVVCLLCMMSVGEGGLLFIDFVLLECQMVFV